MNLKQRERLLVLTALLCLMALLGDRWVLSPLLRGWEARSARILQLRSMLDEGRSLLVREEVLLDRWNQMKRRSLPAEVSAAENEVLKSVSRWLEESRLSMTSLTPRRTEVEEDFKRLEFRATGQGDLASITRFLYELESDPLPLRLEEIEMTARDDLGETLSVGVRFSGLLLLETGTE